MTFALIVFYLFNIIIILKLSNKHYIFDPFLYIIFLFMVSITLTPLNSMINPSFYYKVHDKELYFFISSFISLLLLLYILLIDKIIYNKINSILSYKIKFELKIIKIYNNKFIQLLLYIIFVQFLYSKINILLGSDISSGATTEIKSSGALLHIFIATFQVISISFVIIKHNKLTLYLGMLYILLGLLSGSKTYVFTSMFMFLFYYELNKNILIYFKLKNILILLAILPLFLILLSFVKVVRYSRELGGEVTLMDSINFIFNNMDLFYSNFSDIISSMLNRFDMSYITAFIIENYSKVLLLYSQFELTFIGLIPRFIYPDKPDTGLSITFTPIWIGDYGSGNFGPTLTGSMFFGNISLIILSFIVIPFIYTFLMSFLKAIIMNNKTKILGINIFIMLSTSIIDPAWPFSYIITKIIATFIFLFVIIFFLSIICQSKKV